MLAPNKTPHPSIPPGTFVKVKYDSKIPVVVDGSVGIVFKQAKETDYPYVYVDFGLKGKYQIAVWCLEVLDIKMKPKYRKVQ